MVKLLLALIFSLLTVLPPADALCCAEDNKATLPECCISLLSSAPAVSDVCCQIEGKDTVVPTLSISTIGNERHSYLASVDQSKLIQKWLKAEKTPVHSIARTPERLASNKLYLLKRSLLI